MRFILLITVFFSLGCQWVKPKQGADSVSYVTAVHIKDCEQVGVARVGVREKLWFLERRSKKVQKELITLAKNEALKLRGDTVVALTVIDDGWQDFNVYRCQPLKPENNIGALENVE